MITLDMTPHHHNLDACNWTLWYMCKTCDWHILMHNACFTVQHPRSLCRTGLVSVLGTKSINIVCSQVCEGVFPMHLVAGSWDSLATLPCRADTMACNRHSDDGSGKRPMIPPSEPFIQDTGALGLSPQSPNPNPRPVPFAFLCLRIPVFTKRSGIRLSGSLRIYQFVLHCFLQLDNSQTWPLPSTSATKVLCVSRIKDLLHLNKDSSVANLQHVCLPRRKSQLARETTWANKKLQTSKRCLHDDKYCSAKTNAALHPKALTPVGQSR